MSDSTDLGNRMKTYEDRFDRDFNKLNPVVVRIDGRNFSNLHFQKPYRKEKGDAFSSTFQSGMNWATKKLMEMTNALVGYTQSDEISLVLSVRSIHESPWYNYRQQKLVSVLSSECSKFFNNTFRGNRREYKPNKFGTFDARAFQLPSFTEAANYIVWREYDALSNSVSMHARSMFSHEECMGKSVPELKQMIKEKASGNKWKHAIREKSSGNKWQCSWEELNSKYKWGELFRTDKIITDPDELYKNGSYKLKLTNVTYKKPFTDMSNRTEVLFGDVIEAREDL